MTVKGELMESLLIDAEAALEVANAKCDQLSAQLIEAKATAKAAVSAAEQARKSAEASLAELAKKHDASEGVMLKQIEGIVQSIRQLEAREQPVADMTALEQKLDRLLVQKVINDSVKVTIPALDVVRGADGKAVRLVPRK